MEPKVDPQVGVPFLILEVRIGMVVLYIRNNGVIKRDGRERRVIFIRRYGLIERQVDRAPIIAAIWLGLRSTHSKRELLTA